MKYSDEQLKAMALKLLNAKQNKNGRYYDFVMTLAFLTGLPAPEIEQKIIEFAGDE